MNFQLQMYFDRVCHWVGAFRRGVVTGWGYSEEVVLVTAGTLNR